MLQALTLERNQIKEAMNFSLDNVDVLEFSKTYELLWDIYTSAKVGKFPCPNISSVLDQTTKMKLY